MRLLLALITFGLAVPAAAATLQFEPASSWQVDGAPQMCRLSRDYAIGDEHMTLRLEQFSPGTAVQAVLIGDRVTRAESMAPFTVRLGPNAPFNVHAFPLILPDGRVAMLFNFQLVKSPTTLSYRWPDTAAIATIDEIALHAPVMGTLIFQTRTLARAMEEMHKCVDSMVREWGFDPDQQTALSRQPEPATKAQSWLKHSDFRSLGPTPGQLDRLQFRLDIDAAGAPTACHIIRSYSDPAFAERSCAMLMQRARFVPALDAAGHPIASYWLSGAMRF